MGLWGSSPWGGAEPPEPGPQNPPDWGGGAWSGGPWGGARPASPTVRARRRDNIVPGEVAFRDKPFQAPPNRAEGIERIRAHQARTPPSKPKGVPLWPRPPENS